MRCCCTTINSIRYHHQDYFFLDALQPIAGRKPNVAPRWCRVSGHIPVVSQSRRMLARVTRGLRRVALLVPLVLTALALLLLPRPPPPPQPVKPPPSPVQPPLEQNDNNGNNIIGDVSLAFFFHQSSAQLKKRV